MRLCTLLAGGGADLGCLLGLGAGADGLGRDLGVVGADIFREILLGNLLDLDKKPSTLSLASAVAGARKECGVLT